MAFSIQNFTLASAVANAGTVTCSYPTGTNAASFLSSGHVVVVNNNEVYDGSDISVAFGASLITITNNSGVTWPVNSSIRAQFNRPGANAEWLDEAEATQVAEIIGASPSVSGLTTTVERNGPFFRINMTLSAVSVSVTDAGGSGSYGTLKLFDFVPGAIAFLGARQDYTAFAEGAALTGGAGDAAFEIGVGTTAISAAADGTLGNGVNENVGQAVAVTLSGGAGTGTAVDGAKTTALNGTATAVDLNLNWSGSAATIDANSTISVTGTISVVGVMMGDD